MQEKANFPIVTEVAGEEISSEQLQKNLSRYLWAEGFSRDKDVLEIACGAGQGLGILNRSAGNFVAGDLTEELVHSAKRHYTDRVALCRFAAESMPFPGKSFDVLILFEAIYYLRSVNEFLRECRRILRPGGKVLIATANKDLYDFNPSPYSITYYGVVDLTALFANEGFGTEFFGDTNVYNVSYRQRLLRPIKKVAVALNLIPKTMKGKRWLKRLIFGELQPMPAELMTDHGSYLPPEPIRGDRPDTEHKTILCAATLM